MPQMPQILYPLLVALWVPSATLAWSLETMERGHQLRLISDLAPEAIVGPAPEVETSGMPVAFALRCTWRDDPDVLGIHFTLVTPNNALFAPFADLASSREPRLNLRIGRDGTAVEPSGLFLRAERTASRTGLGPEAYLTFSTTVTDAHMAFFNGADGAEMSRSAYRQWTLDYGRMLEALIEAGRSVDLHLVHDVEGSVTNHVRIPLSAAGSTRAARDFRERCGTDRWVRLDQSHVIQPYALADD